jgi:hypothetical protein
LVKDKVEAHSQGDLRENFGFKAAKDAIRAVDRKMTALDRFVARNTFIEVDPATWLTKPTDTLQLGHVTTLEKTEWKTLQFLLDKLHQRTGIKRPEGLDERLESVKEVAAWLKPRLDKVLIFVMGSRANACRRCSAYPSSQAE